MTPTTLEIKAAIQISKAMHEVFEAIVDPAHMSNYFIADSTGRIEEGKELMAFPGVFYGCACDRQKDRKRQLHFF